MNALHTALVTAMVVVATPIYGGTWRGTTGIELSSEYTDNVFLTKDETESEILLSVRPRVDLSGSGGRMTASINYAPEFRYYLEGTTSSGVAHFLNANADIELIEDYLGIKTTARAGQSLISREQGFTDSGLTNPDNVTNTYALTLSPYLKPRPVGRYFTWAVDSDLDYTLFSSDKAENSSGRWIDLRLASGPFFHTTRWTLDLKQSDTEFDNSGDRTIRVLEANLVLPVNQVYSVLAGLGYTDTDATTIRDINGPYWRLGMGWDPNPRNSAKLWLGERYGETYYALDVKRKDRRLTMMARYDRDLGDTRAAILDPLTTDAGQIAFGTGLGDAQSSGGFDSSSPSLTSALYVKDTFNLGVRGDWRKTAFLVGGYHTRRNAVDRQDDTTDQGLSARLSRKLTPHTTASLAAGFLVHQNEFEPRQGYQQWSAGVQLSRQMSKESRLELQYFLHDRNADDSADDFLENRVNLRWITLFRGN